MARTGMLIALTVSVALAGASAVAAQSDSSAPKSDPATKAMDQDRPATTSNPAQPGAAAGSAATAQPSPTPSPPKWYGSLTPADLIGKELRDKSGKDVADIDDILMAPSSKKLFAVVSVGGIFGIGAKEVAVPLDDLQRAGGAEAAFAAKVSEDELQQLPPYDASQLKPVDRTKALSAATS